MRHWQRGVHSNSGAFWGILLLFLVFGGFVGWMYDEGMKRVPLKNAELPQETKDWLVDVFGNGGHIGVTVVDEGPFEWGNGTDVGEVDKEWSKLEEDTCFVVYYKKDSNEVWDKRAKQVLEWAHEAIRPMKELMGHYIYPYMVNGRRLPIYVCDSGETFNATARELHQGWVNNAGDNTLGVTLTEVGPNGCLTKGILLNSSIYDYNEPKETLWHEMNHYVYLTSLNYGRGGANLPSWAIEGVADYFAATKEIVLTEEQKQLLREHGSFASDSLLNVRGQGFLSAYWGGRSFFEFLDRYTQSKREVGEFIIETYEYPMSLVLEAAFAPKNGYELWMKELEHPGELHGELFETLRE